ncbi:MAG: cytochrome P450 [Rheinheimera aquimaris]
MIISIDPQSKKAINVDFNDSVFRASPYPTYEKMRRFDPVCQVKPDDMWAVSRACDVEFILSHPEMFSSTGIDLAYDSKWLKPECRAPRLVLAQDPPDHRQYRKIVNGAFASQAMQSMAPLMKSIASSLTPSLVKDGPVDFVQRFAYPYIAGIMRNIVGLDNQQSLAEIKEWVELEEQITFKRPSQGFIDAYEAVTIRQHSYYLKVFEDRIKTPRDDLVTELVNAEVDSKKLSNKQLFGLMSLIMSAGFSTGVQMLNNGLILLSRRPQLIKQLAADVSLVPAFVEELLRFSPSGSCTMRITTQPVEIAGITIPEGEMVMALLASANRDPDRFDDPDKFDIYRSDPKRHMSFGHGIHTCVGAALARLELTIAFETLIETFDKFDCPPDDQLAWEKSFFVQGVSELPITCHQY